MTETLFEENEVAYHPRRKYNCKNCGGKKTVAWDIDEQYYVCPDCGYIDAQRTQEAIRNK